MIKTIFFDTSNTLYTSPELKAAFNSVPVRLIAESQNTSLEEAKTAYLAARSGRKAAGKPYSKVYVVDDFGISRTSLLEGIASVDAARYLSPDKRLEAVLASLHETYKLGIITNVGEMVLEKVLSALHVDKNLFSFLVTADKISKSKPNKEPFELALRLSGCTAQECVYVGDGLEKDMVPAKAIGMRTLWLTPTPEDNEHVDVCISTIYDVERAVSKLSRA